MEIVREGIEIRQGCVVVRRLCNAMERVVLAEY